MTECPNADLRDGLPDLLHERLDAPARAAVLAHLDACPACRSELALLRASRAALAEGPRIDVDAVARAVVARTLHEEDVRHAAPRGIARRARWMDWRIAAAITVMAVGSATLVSLRGRGAPDGVVPDTSRTAIGTSSTTSAPPPPPARRSPPRSRPSGAELSMGGGMGDLTESDLRALLAEIQSLDAVPDVEPEPVVVRVAPVGTGGAR